MSHFVYCQSLSLNLVSRLASVIYLILIGKTYITLPKQRYLYMEYTKPDIVQVNSNIMKPPFFKIYG